MKLFDLHCDTITECYNRRLSLRDNRALYISLERGSPLEQWAQCFAVWIPDELRGQAAIDYFDRVSSSFFKESEANSEYITICRNSEDFYESEKKKTCGAFLTVEGGAVLAGDLNHIPYLQSRGVKMLTLTWNGSCELGDGAMVERPKGLTEFGKAAIPSLEAHDILIDVSHASDPLFYDVAARARKPFLASHSNSRKVCDHPRNLTDEQFVEICKRGGVVGLNLHRWFLKENGEATLDDVFRHAYHFLSLGGEKALALGTDFDGAEVLPSIMGIENLHSLADYFSKMGLSDTLIQQIFFKNAKEFLESL